MIARSLEGRNLARVKMLRCFVTGDELAREQRTSMKRTIFIASVFATLTAPVVAADMVPAIAPGLLEYARNPLGGFFFGGHVGYAFGTSSYRESGIGAPERKDTPRLSFLGRRA